MTIIEVRNAVKKYGGITAVAGLNLYVNHGECFWLLGPNGAGKTSLIRMITGLSPLNSDDIRVDGSDIRQEPRQIKAILEVVGAGDNSGAHCGVFPSVSLYHAAASAGAGAV